MPNAGRDERDEVPSPCVKVCRLDAADMCTGCGRRLDEIAEWPQADAARRREIRARAARRLKTKE